MRKSFNLISGFIVALSPIAIALLFGVLIYNELQNFLGIFIFIVLGFLAVWLSIQIFKKVQAVGIIDFITVVNASPDLDNLEPTGDSRTVKRTPSELADLSKENTHLFKGGTLKIFGDWFGEPYRNFLKISNIDYDESKKQMTIQFAHHTKVIMDEPEHILESSTVLKILDAQKVRIEFQHENQHLKQKGDYFKTYQVVKNRIKTTTNIDWTKQKMDASIGQDALIIFN